MFILYNDLSESLKEEKINSLFIITEDLTKAKNRFEENICNIQKELVKIDKVFKI